MLIVLDLENPKKLSLLLEFLKDLKYVRSIQVLERGNVNDEANPTLSREEALKIVMAGCEMTSFGDPVEFQREQRNDRNLPFRDQ